jgi:hypothetical protein
VGEGSGAGEEGGGIALTSIMIREQCLPAAAAFLGEKRRLVSLKPLACDLRSPPRLSFLNDPRHRPASMDQGTHAHQRTVML